MKDQLSKSVIHNGKRNESKVSYKYISPYDLPYTKPLNVQMEENTLSDPELVTENTLIDYLDISLQAFEKLQSLGIETFGEMEAIFENGSKLDHQKIGKKVMRELSDFLELPLPKD